MRSTEDRGAAPVYKSAEVLTTEETICLFAKQLETHINYIPAPHCAPCASTAPAAVKSGQFVIRGKLTADGGSKTGTKPPCYKSAEDVALAHSSHV